MKYSKYQLNLIPRLQFYSLLLIITGWNKRTAEYSIQNFQRRSLQFIKRTCGPFVNGISAKQEAISHNEKT
jgi:hypothetical protein